MNWSEVQMSPAFGFTVVGLIIVAAPIIFERLRLPAVLGLLTFGALIGPNVLDLLPQFTGLRAVGSIGVLYLIFLAGLQLDLETFARFRKISAGFGALTSIVPMATCATPTPPCSSPPARTSRSSANASATPTPPSPCTPTSTCSPA
jgi:Kef-type K+ transport system membrane component KefB